MNVQISGPSVTRRIWSARLAALVVLLLLAANLYVFLTREWESSFVPETYATIYYPTDVPTIRAWNAVGRDRLQLDITGSMRVQEWKILTDGGGAQTAPGMKPSFKIDTSFAKVHSYTLIPSPAGACKPIEISVTVYSSEFYGSLGMQHPDVFIVRSSVPCGSFDQYAVADWVDDYAYVGAEGLAEVSRVLRDEVGIRDSDATMTRMEKLFPYLRLKFKAIGGVPKDDERWMNPWLLHNALVDGSGKGWCTQNAQMWVFWANRAGIPTRFVFGARTEHNSIVYTGHSWAESFIKEQDRWAFVDLSQGHMVITNRTGKVLNTAELFHLNQNDAFDSTFARLSMDWQWAGKLGIPGKDTMVTVPYTLCNQLIKSEYTPHSIFKYRRPPNVEDVREIYTGFLKDRTFLIGNLERYLFKPPLAYSLYPTDGAATYFMRRSLFFAFVVALLIWMVLAVRSRRARASRRAAKPQKA
jgi:hypothetical protein